MLRGVLLLALLTLGLLVPSQPAAAHGGDHTDAVSSCKTTKRANGSHVTRIRWESGRKARRVNMTVKTRLLPGKRELRSPTVEKANPRIVSCNTRADGTVVTRTKSRARYAFVPAPVVEPAPPIETAPPSGPPSLWARWDVPVVLSVAGLDASWQPHAVAAAWNAGLPAGRQISVSAEPCPEGQAGCIPVHVEDLSGIQSADLEPGVAPWGAAWPAWRNGVMESCRIGLNAEVPLDQRAHVMAHEVGHCLGLPHWATEGEGKWSVMAIGAITASTITSWDLAWVSAAYTP